MKRTDASRTHPIDPDPVKVFLPDERGRVRLVDAWMSHLATCPTIKRAKKRLKQGKTQ